jgi:aldehyde dehydrogenase (NAD(P)+)
LDIGASINVFKYYAGAADKLSGSTIETNPTKLAYVLREPLGVCGQIIPWLVGLPTNILFFFKGSY